MNCNPINERKMRKTSDLVQEMRTEAKNAFLVAIAVGFENETKFVFSSSAHPLEDLNKLVQSGELLSGCYVLIKRILQYRDPIVHSRNMEMKPGSLDIFQDF